MFGLGVGAVATRAQAPDSRPLDSLTPVVAEPDPGLPPFDIRTDNAVMRGRIAALAATPVAHQRAEARSALIRRIPGLSIDMNEALATPEFVRSTRSLLTRPVANADPRLVVQRFIADHRALFGIEARQLDTARITRDAVTAHNGVRTIWWQQEIAGAEVVGCDLRANVLPDGRIVSIGSRMLPDPALVAARAADATLTAESAVRAASKTIGVVMTEPLVPRDAPAAAGPVRFARPAVLQMEPTAQRVYFPVAFNDVRPAWRCTVGAAGDPNVYEIIIDAGTGSVLLRENLVKYGGGPASYRVWTGDSPAPMSPGLLTPDGTQAPIVARTLVTLTSIDATASPNGWISAGLNETLGNNVDAHLDVNGDDLPDLPRPQGSPFRVFDFPLDLMMAPTTYQDAAVTQGFYVSNWYHDLIYGLGFTEGFANFQTDNFGRGGVGGDALAIDMQDGAGTNNAQFLGVGADGSASRVQMFIFDGPTPARDGGIDAQILIHELTHGTSIRLHGGLGGPQGGGMGEGWSDFFALAMLADPLDNPNAPYPVGAYTTFNAFGQVFVDNYYYGIRRFPYSTDLSINPLTYADINAAQFAIDPAVLRNPVFGSSDPTEVHNVGEMWCNVLWEARALMIAKHGFAVGNDLIMRLTLDGMKLTTTSSPSMVQSRDAILMADLVDTGGANRCDLWAAFAKRGLGGGAVSASSSTAVITEAFDAALGVDVSIDGGAPDRAQAGTPTLFPVSVVENCGAPLDPGMVNLIVTVDGGAPQAIPLTPGATSFAFTATLPPFACGNTVTYYVSATTADGTFTFPPAAPATQLPLTVLTDTTVAFADNFETDTGWAAFGTAVAGQWQRGVPAGFGDRGDPPIDADGSGQCYLTENGPGNTDVDGGDAVLLSPLLDATGPGDAHLEYFLWYSNDLGTAVDDVLTIELSPDDGATWLPVETLPTSTAGWEQRLVRVADITTPTSTMRLRVTASDTGQGSIVEAGFDGVNVLRFQCLASAPADLNGDGAINGADISFILSNFGPCPPAVPCPSDLNNDGTVGGADISFILSNWTG